MRGRHLTRLQELNGPSNEGYAQTPVSQRRGRRCSTADAYLRPARKRPNLSVVTGALVSKVLVEDGRATGVEYGGERVTARREVVLSAGAIGSPHLLMLSGIGDPDHLRGVGVETVLERPEVGRHLQDHLSVGVVRHCPKKVTLAGAESLPNIVRYLLARRGPFTSNVGEAVVFTRSDPSQPAPDLELVFAPAPYVAHGLVPPTEHGVTLGVVLLRPESAGRITLASADPSAPPSIDPGYLTGESDLRRLVHGLKYADELLTHDALKPYVGEPMDPYVGPDDEEALADYVRGHPRRSTTPPAPAAWAPTTTPSSTRPPRPRHRRPPRRGRLRPPGDHPRPHQRPRHHDRRTRRRPPPGSPRYG